LIWETIHQTGNSTETSNSPDRTVSVIKTQRIKPYGCTTPISSANLSEIQEDQKVEQEGGEGQREQTQSNGSILLKIPQGIPVPSYEAVSVDLNGTQGRYRPFAMILEMQIHLL
jgi:hypothetical protein